MQIGVYKIRIVFRGSASHLVFGLTMLSVLDIFWAVMAIALIKTGCGISTFPLQFYCWLLFVSIISLFFLIFKIESEKKEPDYFDFENWQESKKLR